jgi:hypothetical protein
VSRLLVVWLLVCALPAQALAAVSTLHCAGLGMHGHAPRMAQAAAAPSRVAASASGGQDLQAGDALRWAHAGGHAGGHAAHRVADETGLVAGAAGPGAVASGPVADAAGLGADAAGTDAPGTDAQGRCSACAACCLAAAPLADPPVRARSEPGRSAGTTPVRAFESAVVALPERPPRRPVG